MDARTVRRLVVLAWVLFHAKREGEWRALDSFASEPTCERVRAADVAEDTRSAIGGALADQPADNPIRRDAFRRAEQRIGQRYRCQWQND
jgi:hypothetical protein